MKKWKCTICGYIHEGIEAPNICPKCGAPKEKFVEIIEESAEIIENDSSSKEQVPAENDEPVRAANWKAQALAAVSGLTVRHHAHPILVHVPNGLIPVSFIFCLLAGAFSFQGLATAAFFNLIFVAFSMPLVIIVGVFDWKAKYGGNLTTLFITKMICSAIISVLAPLLTIWMIMTPHIITEGPGAGTFLFVHFIMLMAAGIAGHMGSKLVFHD